MVIEMEMKNMEKGGAKAANPLSGGKKDPQADRQTSERIASLKRLIMQETERITEAGGRIEKLEEERKLERLVSGFGRTFFGYANRPGMRNEVGYLGKEISRQYEGIKAAEKNIREWKDGLSKLNGI